MTLVVLNLGEMILVVVITTANDENFIQTIDLFNHFCCCCDSFCVSLHISIHKKRILLTQSWLNNILIKFVFWFFRERGQNTLKIGLFIIPLGILKDVGWCEKNSCSIKMCSFSTCFQRLASDYQRVKKIIEKLITQKNRCFIASITLFVQKIVE